MLPVNFIVLTFIPVLSGFQHCKTGQYWSKELKSCKVCSTCPTNNIIRKPCTRYFDTVCTKFFEFQDFNSVSDSGKGYHYSLNLPEDQRRDQTDALVPMVEIDEMPTITKDVGQYWKNLAFALIGVLCALIVLATIIVFFACRKLQATTHIKTPEEYDDDADSGYVVIRQIRLAAPQQRDATTPLHNPCDPPVNCSRSLRGQRVPWGYRPKRRLLSDLEYTDDVFESEDSAGSRSSRKMPLSVIHERSDSEGAAETV